MRRGAAEFWLANLVEGEDGKLITSPSSSPENQFTTDQGVTSSITEGATMERSIVWDLFDKTARAAAALGVDADFAAKLQAARDRIRPLQIGKAGQLMEWNGDWDMNSHDLHQRHVSHLYPLYPSDQITTLNSPELKAAAKKTLEIRGDDGPGWSIAWKENLWARLRDGDHAHKRCSGCDVPSQSVRATPSSRKKNGATVGGLEGAGDEASPTPSATRASQPPPGAEGYVIDVLPALPKAWPTGSVKGLRARGGFEADIQWRAGKLVQAAIRSTAGGSARLRYGSVSHDVKLVKGGTFVWNGQ